MKNPILVIIASLFMLSGFSQNNFYIGYELGGLFDRHHYTNENGASLSQFSIGGVRGAHIGYRIKTYTIETGFYNFNSTSPHWNYNFETGEVSKSNSMSDAQQKFSIPLRFGKEFLFAQRKIYLKPEMGINLLLSRDYSMPQPNGGWASGVIFDPENPDSLSFSPYYTIADAYETQNIGLGIETNLTIGFRFKQRGDIYMKMGYLAQLSPMYMEVIEQHSPTETIEATSVSLNAAFLQIGLRLYLKQIEI